MSGTGRRRRLPIQLEVLAHRFGALGVAAVLWASASGIAWRASAASRREPGGRLAASAARGPAALGSASFLLGGFRSFAVDALWLRAESPTARPERKAERLASYRLMVGLDPGNAALRAHLVRRLAIDLPKSEADPERGRDWVREALALGEASSAALPRSSAVARELGFAYLVACREDPVLADEVTDAARRALALFRRARAGDGGRAEDDAAVTVAGAAAGREWLDEGEYSAAAAAFAAAGEPASEWRGLAEACRDGDDETVSARIRAFARAPALAGEDRARLGRVARRFGIDMRE